MYEKGRIRNLKKYPCYAMYCEKNKEVLNPPLPLPSELHNNYACKFGNFNYRSM